MVKRLRGLRDELALNFKIFGVGGIVTRMILRFIWRPVWSGAFRNRRYVESVFGAGDKEMKYIDLTHIFTKDMPVFPAMLPRSFANGFGSKRRCFDQKVISGMHVGTHMDSPGICS